MAQVTLATPVQFLKGVGEKRAAQFHRLHIHTVEDLLWHLPRAYEDWSRTVAIADAPVGETVCVRVTALTDAQPHYIRKGMILYKFTVSDGRSGMQVTLFNNKYAAARVKRGREYLLFGTVTSGYNRYEMASSQIEEVGSGVRIRPIYPQTEGLNSRFIEKTIATAWQGLSLEAQEETLPPDVLQRYGLCTRHYAFQNIHFPENSEAVATARRRLVFEELLVLQLGLLQMKGRARAV
ncbi:MAG: ATP-dependent DNA helicase RecG, partial [Clostridia bacterium]|nr:ATP-dependent DNA helicase RecG [Clostridia bacterium]